METFFILYAVFFVLTLVFKGLGAMGESVGKALSKEADLPKQENVDDSEEKEVERHNDIVFNFRECFNPHEYFSTQERILLRDIDAKEDKMNTNSTLFEAFLLSKDIDKQKRTLSALRSQYRDFCAKCK